MWSPRRSPPGRTGRSTRCIRSCTSTRSPIKVRDAGVVANKAAHLVVGVDLEGRKHVLGIWLQQTEGAKFWSGVLTELRNRGLRDALFVCCDGLTGLPAAVNAVWPEAVMQTCVVHLIRACMRYVSWSDRRAMTAALRPIYTAPTVAAAELAFGAFREDWGRSRREAQPQRGQDLGDLLPNRLGVLAGAVDHHDEVVRVAD